MINSNHILLQQLTKKKNLIHNLLRNHYPYSPFRYYNRNPHRSNHHHHHRCRRRRRHMMTVNRVLVPSSCHNDISSSLLPLSSTLSSTLLPSTLPFSSTSSTTTTTTTTSTATKEENEMNNPLIHLKSISQRNQLCDENGYRKNMCHWTFALSINDISTISYSTSNNSSSSGISGTSGSSKMMKNKRKAPILRTVNFQRVSKEGIDFIMKNKGRASDLLFLNDNDDDDDNGNGKNKNNNANVSILYTTGKYLPGQKVTQWRAQGLCIPTRMKEIIPYISKINTNVNTNVNTNIKSQTKQPNNTIIEMVASVRANKEGDVRDDIMDISHIHELVQQTRIDFENGLISMLEIEEAVRGWRFVPYQIEKMVGSPDQIMWDRREWIRDVDVDGKGGSSGDWNEPKRLMPF